MKALIVDVNSILYKSFYKLMNMTNSKGMHTGALLGLTNVLIKLIDEYKPEYVVCCLDVARSSLKRRELFESYKAHREKAPDGLAEQIIYLERLIEGFNFTKLVRAGYEADDMIASAVSYFSKADVEPYIVSGDKDLLQLVPQAKVILHNKDYELLSTESQVESIMGVKPEQIADLLALQGDASDGIPGIKGIGPKSAIKLIKTYGSIENMIDNLSIPKIEENIEILKIGKKLATLSVLDIDEIPKFNGFSNSLKEVLEELEFNSILKKLDLYKKEEIEILYDEVEKYVLDKDTILLYEDGLYYICEDRIIISKEVDFRNYRVDTYDAKELYKIRDFNLGMDALIGYHLLFTEERLTLNKVIRKLFNVEANNPLVRATYLKKVIEYINANLDIQLYENIEKRLIKVLAKMEQVGVEVDVEYLKSLDIELKEKLANLTTSIYAIAEQEFNIASPKQLSHILFEKMGLPTLKRTKSGFSTDVDVLNELSSYEIVRNILEYRQLAKISNTYVTPLQKTHRVHTTYHQDGTATGRLSSSNPNLQNIPSRSVEGLKVRRAFVSSKGLLLTLDYSQIELRILASLSQDKLLNDAYQEGKDLHLLTAQQIFQKEDITRAERDKAKVVNFSIIYGKSPYGLAGEIGISLTEATNYIERYFKTYPGVKKFINETIARARLNGFVETMFGRKRILKDINNRNRTLRNAAERMAVNSVIQGTQAEIIKKAMIEIASFIKDKNINMVMQVHDELVFEVDSDKYVEAIAKIMKECVSLSVPIEVNSYLTHNWAEVK